MTDSLATYTYSYGAGIAHDRKIDFYRDTRDNPQSFHAVIYARRNAEWIKSSDVKGEFISVDMKSTSEKVRDFFEERELETTRDPIVEKTVTALSTEQQDALLKALQPEGSWKVLVTNDIGEDPRFEKVVSLCLYNPS